MDDSQYTSMNYNYKKDKLITPKTQYPWIQT